MVSEAKKPAKRAAKTAAKTPVKKVTPSKAADPRPPAKVAKTSVRSAGAKPAPPRVGKPALPKAAPPATKAANPAPPAAKVQAPVPPPKPKKSPFSPRDLEAIKQQLIAQRLTLENEVADLNAGTFDTSQSELSGEVAFDEEYADAGTFTFERERDLSLGNNIRDLMDKIDSALVKIERGTYGICERCGEQIDKERMKALPYSVLCIRCKQLEERQR